jgi:hypothetical protein
MKYLLVFMMMLLTLSVSAHDIEVQNADGIIIYYIWTNNNTELAVSYRGTASSGFDYSGHIVIPDSVEYNGNKYSVTAIDGMAFSNNSYLTSIRIPNSVTSIGASVFSGCSSLKSIVVEDGNSVYDSREGCNAIIRTSDNELIAGCVNTRILNSVTSIGSLAFSGSGLRSIKIPNSVTNIGGGAFFNCYSLRSVTIGNNVTIIGNGAFQYCISLSSIEIPNSVINIGEYAFMDCSGLSSVTIGNNVTIIEEGAFVRCSGLKSVTLGNNVTSIESGAFADCSSLSSITIPNSVTSIGEAVFSGCSSLKSITIPNSVISIREPVTIGASVFSGCSSLKSIVVEDGNSVYDSREGCNAIIRTSDNEIIAGCMNTKIPNSVITIGRYAFYDCSGLKSIEIPNSVTSIDGDAFSGCTNLTNVYCFAEELPHIFFEIFSDTPIEKSILHVPESAINAYKTTYPWSKFGSIVALTNQEMSVESMRIDDSYFDYYQLNGQKSFKLKHGLNIIRAKDKKIRKVFIN